LLIDFLLIPFNFAYAVTNTTQTQGKDLGKICEAILDMCVEPPQPSVDNMTILLVRFKHNAQAPAKEQSGNDDDLHGKRKGKAAAAPHRRSF
jgi:hypothetical protein